MVVAALRNEAGVKLGRSPRMADFARWVTAAEPALGWRQGRFLDVYTRNRGEAETQILENSLVAQAVIRLMDVHGTWQGTATLLLYDLTVTVDALANRTTSFLDAAGNVTAIKDASNNLTTFAFDALNRKSGETDPFSKRATFLYNGVGLLTQTVDRQGRKIDYQYDAANRLTTQIWKDSGGTPTETLAFSYDANGNQLTAGNSVGTYTMQYDALNRVTVVQDVWGQRLTFSFDGVGNRTKVQDSKNGVATSVYDGANNLVTRLFGGTSQTPLRVDLTYNADNQIASVTRSSDLAGTTKVAYGTYSYDAVSRLSNLQYRKGSDDSNIANYTTTYDAASRVTSETRNGTPVTYAYDTADQLLGDGTATFTYDGTGNRNNGSYTPGTGNRLTADATWTYSYDDEGNQTKKIAVSGGLTWKYGYDNKNELTSAKKWSSDPDVYGTAVLQQEVDYKYDAFGNRVQKQVDTDGDGDIDTTERYSYDGWKTGPQQSFVGTENWDIWADLDGSNNLQTRYLRGDVIDQLFARTESGGTAYWTLTDRQGSVRDVTENSGVVKDSLNYDGFGNILAGETNSASRGRYAWTAREIETETALQYNRARWYDPATGRWMSQDPLGFDAGDSNLYRYVKNKPTIETDPSGRRWVPTTEHAPARVEILRRYAKRDLGPGNDYLGRRWSAPYDAAGGRFWDYMLVAPLPPRPNTAYQWNHPYQLSNHVLPGGQLYADPIRTLTWDTWRDISPIHHEMTLWEKVDDEPQNRIIPPLIQLRPDVRWQLPEDNLRPNEPGANAREVGRIAAITVGGAGAIYITYRVVRFLPSLAPPLWWTIPGNVALP